MSGRICRSNTFKFARAWRSPFVDFGRAANETFGSSMNRRTSPVCSERQQSTLVQPSSPSCCDNSRANISVPPMRRGSTPNTESRVRMWRLFQALNTRADTLAQELNTRLRAVRRGHYPVQKCRLALTDKRRLVISLVAKSQDSLIFRAQVSQKSRVQQQRMITIIIDVLLLKSHAWIVIGIENCLSRLKHRDALTMHNRSIKQKRSAGYAHQLDYVIERKRCDFVLAQVMRMLLLMRSFDEVEGTTAHVREVHRQLHFPMNRLAGRLLVPPVTMPAMKVILCRQRLPAFGFRQLISWAEIARQNFFHQWMNRDIDKTLRQRQNIVNHQAIDFGADVSVEVVPANMSQLRGEGFLHIAQRFG